MKNAFTFMPRTKGALGLAGSSAAFVAVFMFAFLTFSPSAEAHTVPSPEDVALTQHQQMVMQIRQQMQLQAHERAIHQAPYPLFLESQLSSRWPGVGVEPSGGTGLVDGEFNIRFSGHGFAPKERVTVILDGKRIATVRANRSGRFTLNTDMSPPTPGPHLYFFVGKKSGRMAQFILPLP